MSTDLMIKFFILFYKHGAWKVRSKADFDRETIQMTKRLKIFSENELTAFAKDIKETEPPLINNFCIPSQKYGKVRFGITKIGRVFGYKRRDTGESGNFIILPDVKGCPTYKMLPTDEFNIPHWSNE